MTLSKEDIRHIFEEVIPFNKHLGIKVLDISHHYTKMKLPYRPEFVGDNLRPALHGGVISALLDSVGGAAAMTTLSHPEDRLSTIDIRVDYLLPGDERDIFADGKVIRSGNRIVVTEMIAYHENPRKVIADGRAVYNVRRKGER